MAHLVYGGASAEQQLQQQQQALFSRGVHVLAITIGRLKDFDEMGKISFEKLRFSMVVEARLTSDMGSSPGVRCLKISQNNAAGLLNP